MKNRFSCRWYLPKPVTKATIDAIIDAARFSPSGNNMQSVRLSQYPATSVLLTTFILAGLGRKYTVSLGRSRMLSPQRWFKPTKSIPRHIQRNITIIPRVPYPRYTENVVTNLERSFTPHCTSIMMTSKDERVSLPEISSSHALTSSLRLTRRIDPSASSSMLPSPSFLQSIRGLRRVWCSALCVCVSFPNHVTGSWLDVG